MAKKRRNRPTPPSPTDTGTTTAVLEREPEVVETISTVDLQKQDDRYWLFATGVLLLGIILRQVNLGVPAFHPDEAIHAWFSMGFATYKYDPVYHGPLLYHLVSTVFGIAGSLAQLFGIVPRGSGDVIAIGATDYTARLVPSLCGIGLLWVILAPMRRWLGNRGSLFAALLVAVSPAIVTYSRHLLHDALVLLLTLGAVACLLAVTEEPANTPRGRNARLGLCILLTLFLATKANVFFVLVMLGTYWLAWKICGHIALRPNLLWPLPILMFSCVTLAAIGWPRDNTSAELIKVSEHRYFQIFAVSACAWMLAWLLLREPDEIEQETRRFDLKKLDLITYILCAVASLWLFVFLYGNGAQILANSVRAGHILWPQVGDGLNSAKTAIGRMLEYWGGQQKTPRLPGRHDYYVVLMLLYEVPILIAAAGGIWHACKHRSRLTDLLVWWAFTSWAVYAVANEKVPWLTVHMLLPLALLGGVWLAHLSHSLALPGRDTPRTLAIAAGVAALIFSLRGVSGTSFERAGDNAEPMFYAQTPDQYRDAVMEGLKLSQRDSRTIWMSNERQWPTVWYLRKGAPLLGDSNTTFGGHVDANMYRMMIAEEAAWITQYQHQPWKSVTKEPVTFLIWPRASWAAMQPTRYWSWWLTRQTVSAAERKTPQPTWTKSILSGKGEWSHANAYVALPKHAPPRIPNLHR